MLGTECEVLGTGATGVVLSGIYHGEEVAIKCVDLPHFSHCFESEIKCAAVSHENIIEVFEIKKTKKTGYIIMERMRHDLMTLIEEKALTEKKSQQFFQQICKGIKHFHESGFAHLDIKPENILISNDGKAKVADFSSSLPIVKNQKLKPVGVGSFFYSAPEILQDRPFDGEKADIWSLGILLHVMLTGSWPYFGTTTEEARVSAMKCDIQFNYQIIPRSVLVLLDRMLEIDPAFRPSMDSILSHPWVSGKTIDPIFENSGEKRLHFFESQREKVSRTYEPFSLSVLKHKVVHFFSN